MSFRLGLSSEIGNFLLDRSGPVDKFKFVHVGSLVTRDNSLSAVTKISTALTLFNRVKLVFQETSLETNSGQPKPDSDEP